MRRFLERLLNLFGVRRLEHDLAREIDAHLTLLQDGFEARGLSPDAARRAARLALGNVEQVKEQHRDARSFRWIEDAWQDAALGLRLLRRSPVFTATAALSLAISIGANTAIFTVANALLLRPPAGIANASDLVVIGAARGDGGVNPINHAVYLEIARRTTSLTSVFAEEMFPHVMGMAPPGSEVIEPVFARYVSPNFFKALGSFPFRGRVFSDGDEATGVLDYAYWRRRFNGDDAMVGRVLRINGRPITIVGVTTPDFRGTGIQQCDVWLAIGSGAAVSRIVMGGGRLRPDVSVDTVVAELRTIGQATSHEQDASGSQVRPLSALPFSLAGSNRNVVLGFSAAVMVLVSLVLAVACANVAGIMLTRATARGREIALRAALGAGRGRLVRQLLTETMVLFVFGGLLGIGLARVLTHLAMRMLPPLTTPIVVPLTLDWRVVLFALSLSISAAAVFGVLPALRGSDVEVSASLKDGVRSSSGRSRLRSAFVVGQIACSVLLVVLGASFVRILRHAGAADPGFDARGVDIATLDLSVTGATKAGPDAFWRILIDRVRQMPAVEAASLARVPPGGWEGIGLGGVAPGDQGSSSQTFSPGWNIIEPDYFKTLRIPLLDGRDFAAGDTAGGSPVVILSEALARQFWPGETAVGRLVRLPPVRASDGRLEQRFATVIGVAANIRSSSLIDGLAEPYIYLPLAQSDALGMTEQMSIVARRRGEASLAPVMATMVQDVDQRLVLARTESLADAIALGLTPQRMLATMGSAMGLVAVLLASMGIYGVTAYTVALRRREFAIRLALGAPRARVVQMVIGQGTWLVAVGLGIGLALAVGAGQVLAVLFYGLPATHVPTLAGTVALFLAIGAAASVVPAGQAVRDGWRRALQED
jgi:predicted permease